MDLHDVTRREIFERLLEVETKLDRIEKNTREVVRAFDTAKGAFYALEILGKILKPLLFLGSAITAIGVFWQSFRIK